MRPCVYVLLILGGSVLLVVPGGFGFGCGGIWFMVIILL